MKAVKPKATEKCFYCKAKAVWRSTGLSFVRYACEADKAKLETCIKSNQDDGYMTEGDRQSWGRL